MTLTKPARTKLLGGLTLALLLVLGWFLLLGPKMSAAADTQTQTAAVAAAAAAQQATIKQIKTKALDLDAQRAYGAQLSARFPATAAQQDLFAEISKAAIAAGLSDQSVTSVTPTPATAVVAPPVAATTDPTTAGATATATAPVAPVPTPVTSTAVPLTVAITVTGTVDQLVAFLAQLEASPRAYLLSQATFSNPSLDGPYILTLTGQTFVLPALPDPAPVDNK